MRLCNRCKISKELKDFHDHPKGRDKKNPTCKECRNAAQKKRYHSSIAPPGSGLTKLYGVTSAQYEEMYQRQKGCCAICGTPKTSRRLAVDHDHESGVVRGLLCLECNRGIGAFKESPSLFQKALQYLGYKEIL